MIKSVLTTLAGIVLAVSTLTAPVHAASTPANTPRNISPHPMFVENVSPADLPTTVSVLLEETRAAGWSHLDTLNMSGVLAARGFTLNPVLILELCSGRHSATLLGSDETRFMSSMIPCRVSVYQTSDRRVVISRMNSASMAEMMPGTVRTVIAASGAEMETIIARTLARLAALPR